LRNGKAGSAPVVVLCNLTPLPRHDYRVGVPAAGYYAERLNTDASDYAGSGVGNGTGIASEGIASQNRPHSILLTLPPLATLVLELRHEETEIPLPHGH
jgi:1,4-alpha-glucan branching enzyme